MEIKIPKGRKYMKALLEESAIFFAEQLLPKDRVEDLQIEIELVNDQKTWGTCYCEDWWEKHPNLFLIEISKSMQTFYILKTLAHEFVHVKQHALRELHYKDNSDDIVWLGKKYRLGEDQDDYWDLPWEIEAYGKEEGLVLRFVKKNKHEHKSWFKRRYLK